MRKMILGASAAIAMLGGTLAHAAPSSTARTGSSVNAAESISAGEGVAVALGLGLLVFALFQINDSNSPELPVSR